MSFVESKPFLKWAGGKTQLLPTIISNLPKDINRLKRFIEPFVGAGALFLHIISNDSFEEYIINDINHKLIDLYRTIRDNIDALIAELSILKDNYISLHSIEDKSKLYYELRDEFNAPSSNLIRISALFIFINKTCFNGLYRENSKGIFNVPFNNAKSPSFFDEDVLREISRLLNEKNSKGDFKVKILNRPFEELLEYVDSSTFIYFDPPYRPVTLGGFNSYNKSSFNDDMQIRLRNFFNKCHQTGAKLMLSNSDPKNLDKNDTFFDDLYSNFNIQRVYASRMINSKASNRGQISEILVTNYSTTEDTMKSQLLQYEKNAATFDYLLSTLKDSIKGWDYFVNWEKVFSNLTAVEVKLNILNTLIGKPKSDIKGIARELFSKYPDVTTAIPILLACRDDRFKIVTSDENNLFTSRDYYFTERTNLAEEELDSIIEFMDKSTLFSLFSNKAVKNLVDYVFGVEVGLDSNGRKNRSGHAMEDLVENFVKDICFRRGFSYIKEATPNSIKAQWNYNVTVDKSARRFDFAINTNSKLFLVETNYYGGGGSKLKSTAGEYKTLHDYLTGDGHTLIWITDGKGWLTANRPLEETFYHNDYILNLKMLEEGMLEDIIK